MENEYVKISETEFKEIVQPEPIEVVQTLDDLLLQKKELENGIKVNQDQILFLQAELVKLEMKIASVKILGVKESKID